MLITWPAKGFDLPNSIIPAAVALPGKFNDRPLHPHQTGIGHMTAPPNQPLGFTGPYQGYLNDNCATIAQVLQGAGYHTLMTGKWHLGANDKKTWPSQRGFEHFYGGLSGAFNYLKPGDGRTMSRDNQPVETDKNFYSTDTFTDEALSVYFASDPGRRSSFFPLPGLQRSTLAIAT